MALSRLRVAAGGALCASLIAAHPVTALPSTTTGTLPEVGATTSSLLPIGERIVPEPLTRATYIGFDEAVGFLEALEERYPRFVTVDDMGTSEEGRPLVTLELTDATSDVPYEDRGVVYVSQGIHPNEPGGREGMLRVAEDLLIEAASGDEATLEALADLRIVQSVTNVDSWASGDLTSGGVPRYFRENADGIDLNRELPWPGRVAPARDFARTAEGRAMVADADARRDTGERVVGTADVHGMIQDESAVWTLFSSGQFDLAGWVRQIEQADAIDTRVRDALPAVEALREATGATGTELVTAHRATTSSEFKGGLSGSGFYGDFLAQAEGLDSPSVSTIELFFNNGPVGTYNQATYVAPLVQAHVDSVRAIVRGLIATALVDHEVRLAGTPAVGVVHDPAVVQVAGRVEDQRTVDDEVTPMRFFDDLDPFLEAPSVRMDVDQITPTALADLEVLVLSSDVALDSPDALAAVRDFAEAGGTVVLTDAALQALPTLTPDLEVGDVTEARTMIGDASFVDTDHPLADGVRDDAFAPALHTYEPSTLGFNTEGSSGQAPVWRVERDAFEDAGGTTVATTAGATSVGELVLGEGTVRLIGGLLPLPQLTDEVRFGLANYAPNDTGYLLFVNALGAQLEVTEVPAEFGPAPEVDDEQPPSRPGARPPHAGQPGPPDHAEGPGGPTGRGAPGREPAS